MCFSAYLDSRKPDKCAHGGRELQYLIEANILLKGYKHVVMPRLEVTTATAFIIKTYCAL